MKHKEYLEITGVMECITGLRIGGKKEASSIGETDNPIIRHPVSHHPYVPGSSLKGKLRSLLELKYCPSTQQTGKPCIEPPSENDVAAMFGTADIRSATQPARLIFRDARLSDESLALLSEALPTVLAEVKTEIAMNRNEGKTQSGSLREQERVPAGTKFNLSLTVRLFDEDAKRREGYFTKLAEGFEMLEKDYLGGSGTRGYGKVKFTTKDGKPLHEFIRTLK